MPHYLHKNENGTGFQAWFFGNPREEAKALFVMLGRNGDTVESLRELIRISPQEQPRLKECAAHSPDLADHIEHALQFRAKVEEEFERLVEKNVSSPHQVERKQDKEDRENGDNPDRGFPERQPCEFVEKGTDNLCSDGNFSCGK